VREIKFGQTVFMTHNLAFIGNSALTEKLALVTKTMIRVIDGLSVACGMGMVAFFILSLGKLLIILIK